MKLQSKTMTLTNCHLVLVQSHKTNLTSCSRDSLADPSGWASLSSGTFFNATHWKTTPEFVFSIRFCIFPFFFCFCFCFLLDRSKGAFCIFAFFVFSFCFCFFYCFFRFSVSCVVALLHLYWRRMESHQLAQNVFFFLTTSLVGVHLARQTWRRTFFRGKLRWMSRRGYMSGRRWKPKAGDVVIATPPKTGTTWVSQICHQIRMLGREDAMDFEEITEVVPWINVAWDVNQDCTSLLLRTWCSRKHRTLLVFDVLRVLINHAFCFYNSGRRSGGDTTFVQVSHGAKIHSDSPAEPGLGAGGRAEANRDDSRTWRPAQVIICISFGRTPTMDLLSRARTVGVCVIECRKPQVGAF